MNLVAAQNVEPEHPELVAIEQHVDRASELDPVQAHR